LSRSQDVRAIRSDRRPVCLLCWSVIEPYEPLLIVSPGGEPGTSIASRPQLAERRDLVHRRCVVIDDTEVLTRSERRIALLALRGASDHAIADELGVSASTVGRHLSRVYRKLGISGRAGLAIALSEDS
jgi:DNA-binding CsgD family transcriptional regulator